ncbi:MAG: FkbM family methyltransferase [Desulfovibrionaceae bacterium]|nr:FkbM family methyltransferase [Desulfovibrionaceae bacterium]MBF0513146.1 FkbM family methyltransferase [Desulfovibrionaceae bacterium]
MTHLFTGLGNRIKNMKNKRLVGFLASVYGTFRNKRPCWVSHDSNAWITRQDGWRIADPHICLQTQDELFSQVEDSYLLHYRVKPGNVILDIGAGLGYEAMYFSRMTGETGKVFSIEASPHTFWYLDLNIHLNKITNVNICNCAIADKKRALYAEDSEAHVANRVSGTEATRDNVNGISLDEFVSENNISIINFLKMNIEGFERYAIDGMSASIKIVQEACICCHDFLADAYKDESMRTKELVAHFLKENNFRVLTRDADPRPDIRDTLYAYRL